MTNPEILLIKDFNSKNVPNRNIEIWVPPTYHNSEQQYPVIYIHDGQNVFSPEISYMGIDWGIGEAMNKGIKEGTIPPAIIVSPWNNENRMGEYMPTKPYTNKTVADKFIQQYQIEEPVQGKFEIVGDDYLQFLVEELKPHIDAKYKTLSDQPNTHIMGGSMGGLISLYAICEYPNIFNGAGCVSTHWPYDDGEMFSYFKLNLPSSKNHKIYLDYGDEALEPGYLESHNHIKHALLKNGFIEGSSYLEKIFPGHQHSEEYFRKRAHIPLEFLLNKRE
jgi:predicted alpha/beta superfamily hydrolase